ncbi:MAG TPA: TonB-dependent receptor [Ignavibacteria bacterium]
MNLKKILLIYYQIFFYSVLFSQNIPEYKLDSIVVSPQTSYINSFKVIRNVIEISREDINKKPLLFLNDIFENISGVDIRKRGYLQADLSIRGSTFDQNLIVIDGVPMFDSQTGHHLIDLPLSIENIEKIEILKGSGSRFFGANALGGVINIIPSTLKSNTLSIKASIANNNSYFGTISSNSKIGITNHIISLSGAQSDGYRYNTDFKNYLGFYKFSFTVDSLNFFITSGFSDKKFGANSFYSLYYPDQWENTKSSMVITGLSSKKIDVRLYWKKHNDEYLLFRNQPEKYKNNHLKNNYGLITKYSNFTDFGFFTIGLETGYDEINSNNLGNHIRKRINLFFDNNININQNITISLGSGVSIYNDWKPEYSPGLDISYKFFDNFISYLAFNTSYRIPTFTELYYSSPVNKANSNIVPERARNYELGLKYYLDLFKLNFTIFKREGRNLIDWVKKLDSDIWETKNIAQIDYYGLEFNFEYEDKNFEFFGAEKVLLSYNYISSHKIYNELESKYLLDHLNHQFLFDIIHNFGSFFQTYFSFKYEERNKGDKYSIVDIKSSKRIDFIDIFISIQNVFNKNYVEIGNIPMPGRIVNSGFCVQL